MTEWVVVVIRWNMWSLPTEMGWWCSSVDVHRS